MWEISVLYYMLEGDECYGENRLGGGDSWDEVLMWNCVFRIRKKVNVVGVIWESNRRWGREGRVGDFLEL